MYKCVELYSYNYNKLLNGIMEYCKTDNEDLVEDILLSCGEKLFSGKINNDGKYIILNNENIGGYNPFYSLSKILDEIFNVEDSYGNVICTMDNKFECRDLINDVNVDRVIKKIKSKYYAKCEHRKFNTIESFPIIDYYNDKYIIRYKCKRCGEIFDKYYN